MSGGRTSVSLPLAQRAAARESLGAKRLDMVRLLGPAGASEPDEGASWLAGGPLLDAAHPERARDASPSPSPVFDADPDDDEHYDDHALDELWSVGTEAEQDEAGAEHAGDDRADERAVDAGAPP